MWSSGGKNVMRGCLWPGASRFRGVSSPGDSAPKNDQTASPPVPPLAFSVRHRARSEKSGAMEDSSGTRNTGWGVARNL